MAFLVTTAHNASALYDHPTRQVVESLDAAADVVAKEMVYYEFQMRDGRLFDPDNDDGASGGFDVFEDVTYHDGRPLTYTHFGGDGPIARVEKI